MSTLSQQCEHCHAMIPYSNHIIHQSQCLRHWLYCDTCQERYSLQEKDAHLAIHRIIVCPWCQEFEIEKRLLGKHQEECPRRLVPCDYCDYPTPAIELAEHYQYCGSRTETCQDCGEKYLIRNHECQCQKTESGGNSMVAEPEQGKITCPFCEAAASNHFELQTHICMVHPDTV